MSNFYQSLLEVFAVSLSRFPFFRSSNNKRRNAFANFLLVNNHHHTTYARTSNMNAEKKCFANTAQNTFNHFLFAFQRSRITKFTGLLIFIYLFYVFCSRLLICYPKNICEPNYKQKTDACRHIARLLTFNR